jgi:hypothetical protein
MMLASPPFTFFSTSIVHRDYVYSLTKLKSRPFLLCLSKSNLLIGHYFCQLTTGFIEKSCFISIILLAEFNPFRFKRISHRINRLLLRGIVRQHRGQFFPSYYYLVHIHIISHSFLQVNNGLLMGGARFLFRSLQQQG